MGQRPGHIGCWGRGIEILIYGGLLSPSPVSGEPADAVEREVGENWGISWILTLARELLYPLQRCGMYRAPEMSSLRQEYASIEGAAVGVEAPGLRLRIFTDHHETESAVIRGGQ
jgi:hypothetical protein